MADEVTGPRAVAGDREREAHTEHVLPVVAGVDGATGDEAVTDWAADEAARSGRPLRIVHAVEPGYQLTPYDAVLGELPSLSDELHRAGRAIVSAAATRARTRRPGLEVEEAVEWGSPSAMLVEHSERAAWVVVGAPPRRALERVLLGSVALATVAHARCAVAVVPGGRAVGEPRRIVVGVDGSPGSLRAVELALLTAEPVHGTVTCVVGWTVEVVDGVVVTEPGTEAWSAVESRYDALVHEAVDPFARVHPDVTVEVAVRAGGATRSVLEVAEEREADLVVVGSRGRGGFAGLLLGSVSRRVVERASTVVAVAH